MERNRVLIFFRVLFILLFVPFIHIFPIDKKYYLDRPNEELVFKEENFILQIRARKFRQGELVFFKLSGTDPDCNDDLKFYSLRWFDKKISLYQRGKSLVGFYGLPPEMEPGIYNLEVIKEKENTLFSKTYPIKVYRTKFPETLVKRIIVPRRYTPKKMSEETAKFILKCEEIKKKAFESNSDLFVKGRFILPLD